MYFVHIPPTSYFRYVSILAAVTLFSAVPSLVIKFMAAPSDHWCARPDIMDVPMEERDFSPLAIQVLIIISLIIPITKRSKIYQKGEYIIIKLLLLI